VNLFIFALASVLLVSFVAAAWIIHYSLCKVLHNKGAIERWNRTVRQQFLSVLTDEVLMLEELNIRFTAWIDTYNHRVHSALDGKSPLQCYLSELKAIRLAPEDLPKHFRRSETRLVAADRTVRFMGQQLEAPIGYSGRKLELRFFDYDPLHTCEAFFQGKSIGMLHPVDKTANYQARRGGKS
jgi:putative transposase